MLKAVNSLSFHGPIGEQNCMHLFFFFFRIPVSQFCNKYDNNFNFLAIEGAGIWCYNTTILLCDSLILAVECSDSHTVILIFAE